MSYKISLIMPVRISPPFYVGQTKNPSSKFVRAINSFLAQTYKNCELIIACDGDEEAAKIVKSEYGNHLKTGLIKLLELPRHELFNGNLRQSAIDIATGDVFVNLDSDDMILPNHLYNIQLAFDPKKYSWGYFDIYLMSDNHPEEKKRLFNSSPTIAGLCTTNVIWKKGLDVTWNGCNGKHDNHFFNSQLIEKYKDCIKLHGCTYINCNPRVSLVPNPQFIAEGEAKLKAYRESFETLDEIKKHGTDKQKLDFLVNIALLDYEYKISMVESKLKSLKEQVI